MEGGRKKVMNAVGKLNEFISCHFSLQPLLLNTKIYYRNVELHIKELSRMSEPGTETPGLDPESSLCCGDEENWTEMMGTAHRGAFSSLF